MDQELSRITADEEMEYIVAAAKMGFEYTTIDNGYRPPVETARKSTNNGISGRELLKRCIS